jgi:hypothetical protein
LQTKNPPKKKYKMKKPQVLANEESSKECGLLGEGEGGEQIKYAKVSDLFRLPTLHIYGWMGRRLLGFRAWGSF